VNAWERAALATSLSIAAAGAAGAQPYQRCPLDWNASRLMAEDAMVRATTSHRVDDPYLFVGRDGDPFRCAPGRVAAGARALPYRGADCGALACRGGD
jgi:hypothetical protein